LSSSRRRNMVTLVVATTIDPASIGPASALLSMPGWHPGPPLKAGFDIPSYVNGQVRLLKHDNSIVSEDHLDKRWEESTGEVVDDVIFLSKHTAVSNRPALTVHPIGIPHLREGEVSNSGGKPGWAAPPNPRIASWLRLLKKIAQEHNLIPEFEITMEATHHGPEINSPTMFVEIGNLSSSSTYSFRYFLQILADPFFCFVIVYLSYWVLGSTEEYWKRQDAAQAIAQLVWEGLGLGGAGDIGNWNKNNDKKKVLLGLGGGHYVPRHMDIVLKEDSVWVGHLLSGYSLPMEDPKQTNDGKEVNGIGGTWKQAIKVSYDATCSAFPGGEIMAHLDQKSFKSWQKNAITSFLNEQNIKIGKPSDFS
ncbi:hypothetical protein C5167_035372, partial [Papaver somniferum]